MVPWQYGQVNSAADYSPGINMWGHNMWGQVQLLDMNPLSTPSRSMAI